MGSVEKRRFPKQQQQNNNTKLLILLVSAVLFLSSLVEAKPWINDIELNLPREVDPENPIEKHETDCTAYYNFNAIMRCAELHLFNPETNTCEPEDKVKEIRPECA